MRAGGNATGGDRPYGTDVDTADSLVAYAPEIARCDATREGSSQDYETTTMVAHAIQAGALRENPNSGPDGVGVQEGIAYTLEARAEVQAVAFQSSQSGVRIGDVHATLDSNNGSRRHNGVLCFSAKDYGADAQEGISPTLRAGGHADSHANAGVMPAVAFNARQDPIHGTIAQPLGAKDNGNGVLVHSAVRRLTPRECERLQGFPDDYTNIPWRGKPTAPDGPRYKALGNSWAVPKFRWLGERINRLMPQEAANDNTTNKDTSLAA